MGENITSYLKMATENNVHTLVFQEKVHYQNATLL
jgi:hypothetical protein